MFAQKQNHQPITNIPSSVWSVCLLLIGIFLYLNYALTTNELYLALENYALFPALFSNSNNPNVEVSEYLRFLTYGFVHIDTLHITMNCVWLVVFGVPIARKSDALFFSTLLTGIIAGALLYMFLAGSSNSFLIGISAGVSALLGALLRIGFDFTNQKLHLRSFKSMLADKKTVTFLGIWLFIELGINGLFSGFFFGQAVAWQAHIGGLFWGILWVQFFSLVIQKVK